MDFGGQPLLKMNNGLMIPQLGFGVYLIKDLAEAEKACLEAFKVGYRHIDTAHRYDNEKDSFHIHGILYVSTCWYGTECLPYTFRV